MPMFHAFINVSVLPVLRAGGKVITLPEFEPQAVTKALITYKVNLFDELQEIPNIVSLCLQYCLATY
jgi:hypothetical protein